VIALVSDDFFDAIGMDLVLAFRVSVPQSGRPPPHLLPQRSSPRLPYRPPHRHASVTATMAPVSMSTAFSALNANAVRPSFSRVISASGSLGFSQTSFGHLLGALAIHAPQRRCVFGMDPFGFGQSLQIPAVALARIAPHDRLSSPRSLPASWESTPMVLP